MPILNYTTQIDTDQTLAEIQKCLSTHGANAILAEYDASGLITALSFKVSINGKDIAFRLPNKWESILSIMERDTKVKRPLKTKEQAIRVSWRIIKVWIDAQMALLETSMVKMEQIFLPYAVGRDGKTMYETLITGEYKHLLLGPSSNDAN